MGLAAFNRIRREQEKQAAASAAPVADAMAGPDLDREQVAEQAESDSAETRKPRGRKKR